MAALEESAVRELWCEMLGVEKLDESASFIDLGGTSIAAEQLAARIADSLGIDVSGLDVLNDECYANFIERLRGQVDAL